MTDNTVTRMIDRFRHLPTAVRKGLTGFFGLAGLIFLLDLVIHKHGDYWWNFFGFHSLFGFVACVVLVLVATWMRKPLMRDEQYYHDESESESDSEPDAESKSK